MATLVARSAAILVDSKAAAGVRAVGDSVGARLADMLFVSTKFAPTAMPALPRIVPVVRTYVLMLSARRELVKVFRTTCRSDMTAEIAPQ